MYNGSQPLSLPWRKGRARDSMDGRKRKYQSPGERSDNASRPRRDPTLPVDWWSMRVGLASVSALCVLLAPRVVWALSPAAARPRVITDVIHRSITLHPLCVQIVDTPEFQRLRGISQLGPVQWVFPCARHDRFQHALGVSHLASEWARQFQREQPELKISDQEVLCVTIAGLVHDLGHGPFSHFWEGSFLPAVAAADPATRAAMPPAHEEISCR